MNDDPWKPRKVVIVGAGAVGSTFAYALAQSGLADVIALRDANHELAMGQVLDLAHGQAFFPSVQIREAQAADYADARMIVITAGPNKGPASAVWICCNETSKSSTILLTKSWSRSHRQSF